MVCLLDRGPGADIIRKWGWKAMLLALKRKTLKFSPSFFFWRHRITLIKVLKSIIRRQGPTTDTQKWSLYLLDASTKWLQDARVLLHIIIVRDSTNKDVRVALNLREASLPTDQTRNMV